MDTEPLKLFIVDDEPSTRIVIASQLDAPSYEVAEFECGEDCLAALDPAPDIILLDVEMPGMNGIDVCRALREAGHTDTYVIFISALDDIETRMIAYDAGGNDYVVKPFSLEEIEQKVQVAGQILARQRVLEQQTHIATQTAFTAMSSMGELSAVLQFLQASFACQSFEQLGAAMLAAIGQYDLEGLLELRSGTNTYAFSSRGACSPLENSILANMRKFERVFQFCDRLTVNYPCVTLVISHLPINDPDRVGRLRDHLVLLAEGANARVASITSELQRLTMISSVSQATADLATLIEMHEQYQSDLRLRCIQLANDYVLHLEKSFVHLGLSEIQEQVLSDEARKNRDDLGDLLGEGRGVAGDLLNVITNLRRLEGG